jgi:hypothetical protein
MNSVYIHRRSDNGEIFYIGTGVKDRPYEKEGRTKHWGKVANEIGYEVEVVADGLEHDYALMLEAKLINQFKPSQFLVNKSPGNINKFPIYGITICRELMVMRDGEDVKQRGFNLQCVSSVINGNYKHDNYLCIQWFRCLDATSLNHLIELKGQTEIQSCNFFDSVRFQGVRDKINFNSIINDNRLMSVISYTI